MRLVDADKLKVLVAIENGEEPITKGELVTGLFDGVKTVEAIPIEWVRKYMGDLPDGSMAYECILVMLEEWEKENETH